MVLDTCIEYMHTYNDLVSVDCCESQKLSGSLITVLAMQVGFKMGINYLFTYFQTSLL